MLKISPPMRAGDFGGGMPGMGDAMSGPGGEDVSEAVILARKKDYIAKQQRYFLVLAHLYSVETQQKCDACNSGTTVQPLTSVMLVGHPYVTIPMRDRFLLYSSFCKFMLCGALLARWLLFLRHCAKCQAPDGSCQYGQSCTVAKQLWRHILTCSEQKCSYPR